MNLENLKWKWSVFKERISSILIWYDLGKIWEFTKKKMNEWIEERFQRLNRIEPKSMEVSAEKTWRFSKTKKHTLRTRDVKLKGDKMWIKKRQITNAKRKEFKNIRLVTNCEIGVFFWRKCICQTSHGLIIFIFFRRIIILFG